MARQCFYSFHYAPDCYRAAQVRNIGVIEGNRTASDNTWESVKSQGEAAIKRWIDSQMKGRSCTIVLVGTNTAGRKWINYEITESWNSGMGVVGIRIHGLKNSRSEISTWGDNPFDKLTFETSKKPLSSVVKCYNPAGNTSRQRYAWISKHLSNAVEEAIRIRANN